ncbi:DNA cytosine methyltransferase [Brochothrix campestris]|uniref:Cytosine-specific methyltransferase n=1 Tax=Brochothrix campestris FSL F6-1037 TaxID=1265861 RepID=W7CBE5_9LIST|nr:DNA (cytosine-5-)-methyltransferase [Brochothrix campestris]EUJ34257.1 DNA-cytosine methyltransferase [Brochothrix campestris FSL F6-1037]
MIKILELFGGIGAPRKALVNLGVEHKSIDYVEWNEKAVRTYNAMFDNRYKAQSVVGYDLKPDILIHGSPCQDFSIGGKQYGGNVEDGTRSSLMFETIKIIENLGVWKPKVVVWENVKNVLSKKHVGAFNHYLDDMERLGYTNRYEVLNLKDFGIPQNRERLFMVSILGDTMFNFNLVNHRPTKPIEDFLTNNYAEQHVVTQPSMIRKIGDNIPKEALVGKSYKTTLKTITDTCNTITTKQMRCPNAGIIKLDGGKYRYLTELEVFRLMGFDDEDFKRAATAHPGKNGKLNGALYHQAGNSIGVPILEEIFKTIINNYIKNER